MSQIATTIEQSKRLLAAGIDPKSADMYWLGSGATISPDEDEYKLYTEPFSPLYERVLAAIMRERVDCVNFGFDNVSEISAKEDFLSRLFPAWSLSRLIDLIAETGIPMNYGPMKDSADVLECAVRLLEYELEDANH